MKTVVFTSDTHNWLLRGFFHQWAKYGNELTVEVAGFTNPGFLPDYATFYSIGKFEDYPVEKWSNSIIEYLNKIDDDLFLFLLEDYWLIRPINMDALHTAERFMTNHPEVGRFDVAADRVFNRSSRYIGSMDLIDSHHRPFLNSVSTIIATSFPPIPTYKLRGDIMHSRHCTLRSPKVPPFECRIPTWSNGKTGLSGWALTIAKALFCTT